MRRALLAVTLAIAPVVVSCGGSEGGGATTTDSVPSGPSSSEITFESGDFTLVGDLDLPGGPGPHPALALVHSSGPQTRTSTPTSGFVKAKFLEAG